MAVTIKDVAKRAGVSYSTVSRALNGASCVNEAKKREIERIAKEMGYIPNLAAVQLKKSRSGIIGIYVQDLKFISSPYSLYPMLNRAYDLLGKEYSIVVKSINKHIPGSLNPALYDGIICMDTAVPQTEFWDEVKSKNIPLVIANFTVDYDAPRVTINQEKMFYEITKKLIELGNKKITILHGEPERVATMIRMKGCERAMDELGFDKSNLRSFDCKFSYMFASSMMEVIMQDKPDAILSFNDEMAFAAINYLKHTGYSVPDDVSVVGFDNWDIPMCDSCGLTNIDRGMADIAEKCVILLKAKMSGHEVANDIYFIDGKLIDRGSVKGM